ncbi:MAG: hypothetical protein ACREV3_13975 [Gammaproteobacteria bacterium]
MECTRLRVKDVDFDQHQLVVRDGKRRQGAHHHARGSACRGP